MIGYILITTNPYNEADVYRQLNEVDEIVEVHPLFGEYDIIAKVEVDNFEQLGQIVVNKVRIINGVIDTKTLSGIGF